MEHYITLPLTREKAAALRSGDTVYLTGDIFTARDAAHKRLTAMLAEGKALPFALADAVIYYVGPTPAPPGKPIGSCGPTTSYRMDAYTPLLLRHGLRGMIGKGERSAGVIEAMREAGAVYFGAIGGAGALLSDCVEESVPVAFEDLGPEAVRRLRVRNFPVVVVIDAAGENLYRTGPARYLDSLEMPPEN